jgi:glutathione S-transferase
VSAVAESANASATGDASATGAPAHAVQHAPSAPVRLYVIPGSHACRAAMLMLEHKGVAYELVDLPTGAHPLLVRLRGFPGNREPLREVDGGRHAALAVLDRLGTVPALAFGSERVQTNRRIARFLESVVPEPPLFPADAAARAAVEEAEEWGDEVFQMAARRIALAAAARSPDELYDRANSGRLGPLLAHNERVRIIDGWVAGRIAFRASEESEKALLGELPAMLDRIDEWIAQGVLGGELLYAADFMIAPSVALLAYRHDLRGDIDARPAGRLMDRILPLSG